MTRFLSDSLHASQPAFSLGLQTLERSLGMPSHDIRLSTDVQHATRLKIKQLGLDPLDTTGYELYGALIERIRTDDARLVKTLRTRAAVHVSAEADVVAGMVHALRIAPFPKTSLVLKSSRFKALIKKHPPKKAMKQLGYRSVDSFLKHEAPALILAAASLTENDLWQRGLVDAYKRLKPTDFETSTITIAHPNGKRWQTLTQSSVAKARHNVLSFPEIGSIVLLPLPVGVPAGVTTASLLFALHALSNMRASNTYLKVSMVRPDFGAVVQAVASGEPQLGATLLERNLPWQTVQHYYSKLQHRFREELFEPHIQLEDVTWPSAEQILAHIEPSLSFWHESAALGMLFDHKPLSLNVVDAALNLCNRVPFEGRIVHYFQESLWGEVALRYLTHETIEKSVLTQLQPQFEYAAAN
jgi:hypothetical protein